MLFFLFLASVQSVQIEEIQELIEQIQGLKEEVAYLRSLLQEMAQISEEPEAEQNFPILSLLGFFSKPQLSTGGIAVANRGRYYDYDYSEEDSTSEAEFGPLDYYPIYSATIGAPCKSHPEGSPESYPEPQPRHNRLAAPRESILSVK